MRRWGLIYRCFRPAAIKKGPPLLAFRGQLTERGRSDIADYFSSRPQNSVSGSEEVNPARR